MLRKALYSLLGVVALLAVIGGVGAGWVWTTLPEVKGSLDVRGLEAPVEILRDRAGVPHILAKSARDAYFALGFVHAQDRFWQMEAMRRLGAGRMAEVMGAEAVASDKWMRTLGLYKLAEKQFQELSEPVKTALTVYAAGVNAQLEESRKWPWRRPAIEFWLLRYEPQPWKPADSLVWGKIMAMRLGGNWQDEILRARLARKLAPQRVGQLWPLYPDDAPNTVDKVAELTRGLDLEKLAAASPEPAGTPRGASNAWAVARQHTTTRGAILANDPHLRLTAPILWYLARLKAADLDVVGATVPGMPFTILGQNARIAWGMTSTHTDIQDLFVEQIEADGKQYRTPDGMKPFESESQTIAVKGGDPVKITVRRSRHGPIVSDAVDAIGKVAGKDAAIALAATFLEPKDRSAWWRWWRWAPITWAASRRCSTRTGRRRSATSCSPIPPATSASWRRAWCRCARKAGAWFRARAGTVKPTGTASCRSTICPRSTTRRAAASSTPTTASRRTVIRTSSPSIGRRPTAPNAFSTG